MNKEKEPKSLLEVRSWKKSVAKETRKLPRVAVFAYFNKSVIIRKMKKAT